MSQPRFIPSFDNALNRAIARTNDKNHRAYGLYIYFNCALILSNPLYYGAFR